MSKLRAAGKALASNSFSIVNYTLSDCQLAHYATSQPLMQTLRFVHIFFCLLGVIASSLFIFVLISRFSRNLHVNLRISLASVTCAAWMACTQLLFTAIYGVVRIFSEEEMCSVLSDSTWCSISRFPIVLAIYSTLCGIIVIAVERTIATINYKEYEVHGSRIVAVSLVIGQWLISIVFSVISSVLRSEPGYVHYCTVYVAHPKSAVYSISLMSVLEVSALLYIVVLLHRNQQRQVKEFVNNAMHTLTERYQLQENVRMMRILIPSVTVHCLLGLIGLFSMLGFVLIHRSENNELWRSFAPFSELVLLIVPIHALVFPMVAISMNTQLRQATRRALPFLFNRRSSLDAQDGPVAKQNRLTVRTSQQLERDSDTHFDLLKEMWSK